MNNTKLLDAYDAVVNLCLVNFYTLSNEKKEIVLTNIDRKNKEHLFILRVALIAKDVLNSSLYFQTGFWNWLVLNWKLRKLSCRIPRIKNYKNTINVQELLDFMRPGIEEFIQETAPESEFNFGDIYDEFYKGELD